MESNPPISKSGTSALRKFAETRSLVEGLKARQIAANLLHGKIPGVKRSVVREVSLLKIPLGDDGLAALLLLGEMNRVLRRQSQSVYRFEVAEALFQAGADLLQSGAGGLAARQSRLYGQTVNRQHVTIGGWVKVHLNLDVRGLLGFVAKVVQFLTVDFLKPPITQLCFALSKVKQRPCRGENSTPKAFAKDDILDV